MKAHKKWKVLAVAAALAALGVAGNAQAGVLAQGTLQITSFKFLNPDGSDISIDQIFGLDFQDSSQITATLNGVSDTGTINSTSFGILDLAQQCVDSPGVGGPVCASFGENNFSLRFASTVDVARGDSLLVGAPIATPVTGVAGADARLVAEAQLDTSSGTGNTNAELGLTASFNFALNADQTVTISMLSLSHLIAQIDAAKTTGTARASEAWTISVAQGDTVVFDWTPNGAPGDIDGGTEVLDQCDLTVVRSAQTPGVSSTYDCAGGHIATTGTLTGGLTYTLSLTHLNTANISAQIPEPGSLLLLGLGLAGLGFVGYRGKKVAA